FVMQWSRPELPFAGGARLVGIEVRDTETGGVEPRILHDFARWKEDLRSVEELGAFRLAGRNLVTGDGPGEPVLVTEVSASAFRLVGAPPLHGRTLLEDDERANASPVVVIGHDLWQDRFGGRLDAVGTTIRLGGTQATVVGVMPEGFEFPHSQNIWTSLRFDPLEFAPGEGPAIYLFGRLAPGASLELAQAEIETLGFQAAAAYPETHAGLAPRVVPFPELVHMPAPGLFNPEFLFLNLFILALVVLLCANVALLLFARAATRESELVVRSALGAGRRRIVLQLFSEALVLGGVATVVGLMGAKYGYEWFLTAIEGAEGPLPFWFEPRISPTTVLYALGLTVVGAAVAGILPALKVTRGVAASLRESTAGGGGLRFGGVWTLVIVAQVALTMPLPAFTYFALDEMAGVSRLHVDIATENFLTARLELDRDLESIAPTDLFDPNNAFGGSGLESDSAFLARYASNLDELERRLLAEPAVRAVTFVDRLPLTYHPAHQVELDEGAITPPDDRGHRISTARIEPNYFEAFGVPILVGRGFDSEDVISGARVVIVDEPFVERVLGGRNPIGLRLRYIAIERAPPPGPDAPWYEIVGVVGDLGMENGYGRGGVYHPVARGENYPASLVIHLSSDPTGFSTRLRTLGAEVDPTLRVESLTSLEDIANGEEGIYAWGVSAVVLLTFTALMLSLAGIYAVMSFAVSRRTREIGIRVALGAKPRSLLLAIFRRPLVQVGLGVLAGAYLLGMLSHWMFGGITLGQMLLVAVYALVMAGVCLLACVVPTRRALGVEPVTALRAEG
ncbi:MAG: ABC transporter permease, partial [Gemmatimonadota bacterium]